VSVIILTNEEKKKMLARLDDFVKAYATGHWNGINLCFCETCEPELHKIREVIKDVPEIK